MTPLTELQDFFACAAENAARLFNASGEVLPMWHSVNAQGEHVLIATPWANDEEKDLASERLRLLFKATGVKRFAFIAEAWTAPAKTMGEVREGPRPSAHPDRREILMISAEDRWGNTLS